MTRPQYSGLSGHEKATAVFFAVNTLIIVESGRCAAPYSEEAAVENFLLTFLGLSHSALQPVVTLPNTRKAQIVGKAMELASEEGGRRERPRGALGGVCCRMRSNPCQSGKHVRATWC